MASPSGCVISTPQDRHFRVLGPLLVHPCRAHSRGDISGGIANHVDALKVLGSAGVQAEDKKYLVNLSFISTYFSRTR